VTISVIPYLAVVAAIGGLGLAFYYAGVVKKADPGTVEMQEIAAAIREGSMAFLSREARWVIPFTLGVAALLAIIVGYGWPWGALSVILGAFFTGLSGVIGMRIATLANVRTTQAARVGGLRRALPLAYRGGAVMGLTVNGLGLLGIALCYILFVEVLRVDSAFSVLAGFVLGASVIALFARIGGGIYTKAADIGADLVGKIEAGIPEDDPRNPATIADNVGDNVGDVAGMGSDLLQSYTGSMVAPMVLGGLFFGAVGTGGVLVEEFTALQEASVLFPLYVATIGMIASIIGALLTRARPGMRLSLQLHFGSNAAIVLTALGVIGGSFWVFGGADEVETPWLLGLAVVIGLVVGYLIGLVSEYYTSDHYKPVKKLAKQAETGPATVIIAGTADGMLSTAGSVILITSGIGFSYMAAAAAMPAIEVAGLYGSALAAIGILAAIGAVVAVDAYGPIADNAGGIAEMAHLPPEVREVTDALDSLGNTTAAIAKGFAIGSAVLVGFGLFKSYSVAVDPRAEAAAGDVARLGIPLEIGNVEVMIGLFLGAMLTFVIAALSMKSVGRAANQMIIEVRRQFAEIPGLREGREGVRADYARCVDISTASALREMMIPGALGVFVPLIVGFISPEMLGGLLAGALVGGFLIAIYMANAGGAWDNAKKWIEAGNLGGKGSDAHHAAVVGDTVGDPFKDTAGPSMNILLKLMTVVALTFAPAFIV
jgi:K(+)-stimulated pyrophosphate-energized sodium pump